MAAGISKARREGTSPEEASGENNSFFKGVRSAGGAAGGLFQEFKALLAAGLRTTIPGVMPEQSEPQSGTGKFVRDTLDRGAEAAGIKNKNDTHSKFAKQAGKFAEGWGGAAVAGTALAGTALATRRLLGKGSGVAKAAQKTVETVCKPEVTKAISQASTSSSALSAMGSAAWNMGKAGLTYMASDALAETAGQAVKYVTNSDTQASLVTSNAIKYASRGYAVGGILGPNTAIFAALTGAIGGAIAGLSSETEERSEQKDWLTQGLDNYHTSMGATKPTAKHTVSGLGGILGGTATAAVSTMVTSNPLAQSIIGVAAGVYSMMYLYNKSKTDEETGGADSTGGAGDTGGAESTEEADATKEKAEEAQKKLAEAQKKLAEAQKNVQESQKAVEDIQGRVEEAAKKLEEVKQEQQTKEVLQAKNQSDLKTIETNKVFKSKSIKSQIEQLNSQEEYAKKEIIKLDKQISEVSKQIEDRKSILENPSKEHSRLKEELALQKKKLDQDKKDIEQKQSEIKELDKKIDTLSDEILKLQEKSETNSSTSAEERIKLLDEKIAKNKELKISNLDKISKTKQQVQEIENSIEAINKNENNPEILEKKINEEINNFENKLIGLEKYRNEAEEEINDIQGQKEKLDKDTKDIEGDIERDIEQKQSEIQELDKDLEVIRKTLEDVKLEDVKLEAAKEKAKEAFDNANKEAKKAQEAFDNAKKELDDLLAEQKATEEAKRKKAEQNLPYNQFITNFDKNLQQGWVLYPPKTPKDQVVHVFSQMVINDTDEQQQILTDAILEHYKEVGINSHIETTKGLLSFLGDTDKNTKKGFEKLADEFIRVKTHKKTYLEGMKQKLYADRKLGITLIQKGVLLADLLYKGYANTTTGQDNDIEKICASDNQLRDYILKRYSENGVYPDIKNYEGLSKVIEEKFKNAGSGKKFRDKLISEAYHIYSTEKEAKEAYSQNISDTSKKAGSAENKSTISSSMPKMPTIPNSVKIGSSLTAGGVGTYLLSQGASVVSKSATKIVNDAIWYAGACGIGVVFLVGAGAGAALYLQRWNNQNNKKAA